jgi:mono/diheme cytochrome c family protein
MTKKHSPLWALTLLVFVALGLSACGGDGAGEEETQAEPAQANVAAAPAESAEAEGEMSQELPEGVTAEMIEEGKTIYNGAGICMSCHGGSGEGIPNLGADLTDEEWLHSDGSYDGISETVMNGVTAQESSTGVPMPAKGGTAITDDQVEAVAAYVWSLNAG